MKVKECVYCGKTGPVTRDHVPPKCLFVPPFPANMITVPACHECHDDFKKDDEYFRLCLAMRPDVVATPEGQQLWKKSLRSLTKPQAGGLKRSVISSLRSVEHHTPAGIYLGNTPGFKVDKKRFKLTARRILYGLFFKVIGHRIPDGYEVSVYYEEFQKDLSALQSPEIKECLLALTSSPLHQLGNALSYRYGKATEDPNASFWILQVVNSMRIFGVIVPHEEVSLT